MTGTQCRMARAALGWTMRNLHKHSGIHFVTIAKFEHGRPAYSDTLRKLVRAFGETGKVQMWFAIWADCSHDLFAATENACLFPARGTPTKSSC